MHVRAITYNFMNRPQLKYIGIRATMNFELVHDSLSNVEKCKIL